MIRPLTSAAMLMMLAACDRSADQATPAEKPAPAATSAPAAMPTLSAAPATRPAAFAPGDLIELTVNGMSPSAATGGYAVRVQANGTVGLPWVGPVAIGGRDRKAAVLAISKAFQDANVVRAPAVDLRLLQVAGTGGPAPSPLAAGDLVRCGIIGLSAAPGEARSVVARIDPDGNLVLPFVAPVPVAGLTDATAAKPIADAYRKANVLNAAVVIVLTLEKAPADAAHLKLPDGPILPVPEPLRHLYATP